MHFPPRHLSIQPALDDPRDSFPHSSRTRGSVQLAFAGTFIVDPGHAPVPMDRFRLSWDHPVQQTLLVLVGRTRMLRWTLLLFLTSCGCDRGVPQRNHGLAATEGEHLATMEPDVWTLDGQQVNVRTYYMALESGIEYTIDLPRMPRAATTIEVEAWPIVRSAFETKRYLRARIDAYGQQGLSASRIGVRFHRPFEPYDGKSTFVLGISEVRHRIDEERRSWGAR